MVEAPTALVKSYLSQSNRNVTRSRLAQADGFVILQGQNQLGGDDLSGKLKLKVEPLPTSLSTQIFPPCSSTNFLAKVSPSPVPSILCVESEPTCRNSSKIFGWSSGEMPIPVSLTEISAPFSVLLAVMLIRPPSGVNFTALDKRLSRICLILRSSPMYSPNRSSTSTSKVIPCLTARSRTNVRALSIANGRSNSASSNSMRPASTLERSRISLIRESRC